MVQEYLPIVKKGDKRIILINGEPVGCLNRVPAEGEFRSNLGVGGLPELSELSSRDIEICQRIRKTLIDYDLYFVGIDVIGDFSPKNVNANDIVSLSGIGSTNGLPLTETMLVLNVDNINGKFCKNPALSSLKSFALNSTNIS